MVDFNWSFDGMFRNVVFATDDARIVCVAEISVTLCHPCGCSCRRDSVYLQNECNMTGTEQ